MQPLVDLFPANLTLPNGEPVGKVRVIVTDTNAYAFQSWQGVPTLIATSPLAEPWTPSPMKPWQVPTTAGTWTVRTGSGCGCGDRLKVWSQATLLEMVSA